MIGKSAVRPGIREEMVAREPPLLGRADWREEYPGLVQGITLRHGAGGEPFDLRLDGPSPTEEVLGRWERLRESLGVTTVVRSRQVHGGGVRVARAGGVGVLFGPPGDGHLTRDPGVLLTVSVADCVPVYLLGPRSRAVGLLHAGWRGTAGGILEAGVASMWDRFGIRPDELHVHLGPAIGGDRYEVGPEVYRALGLADPGAPAPLDLRAHLGDRARAAGVRTDRIGVSQVCVRQDSRFFSHRGGDAGRQVAVLGWSAGVGLG